MYVLYTYVLMYKVLTYVSTCLHVYLIVYVCMYGSVHVYMFACLCQSVHPSLQPRIYKST